MSEPTAGIVELRFEDGSRINAWLSFQMRDTYSDPLGELQFVAQPTRDKIPEYRALLAKGSVVAVMVNGAPQGVFLITSSNRTIGRSGGVVFSLTCKSPLVTAYEGCVDPDFSFSVDNDTPVTTVVLNALSPYGFDSIQGDSAASVNVSTGKPVGKAGRRSRVNVEALKTQDANAHDGERAYAFVARLVTRLGVQLKMDVASGNVGTLLLQAPDYEQDVAYTVVLDPLGSIGIAGSRFVGDITIEDTNDDQYSECMVRGVAADKGGATSTSEPIARVTAADINAARPTYSSFAAGYKPLFIKDKNSRDVTQATSVAKLAMGLRGANAFSISGEVDGIIAHSGRVWTVGTMARVVVPDEQIDEPMFLFERVLIQDRGEGQRTRLKFVPKNSYVIGDLPEGG